MNTEPTLGPEFQLQDLSSILWLNGSTTEALKVAIKAVTARQTVPTCINMAVILESLTQFDEALIYARMAYETDPTDARAVQCYGEHLLRMGKFREGWPLYCWLRANEHFEKLQEQLPEWNGQLLWNRRLLIIGYGGFGDNFYFMHTFSRLRDMGANIIYVGHPPLSRLIALQGYNVAKDLNSSDFKSYDFYSTIFSLGMKLGWSLENPLWSGPYIRVPWYRKFKNRGAIGLCFEAGEKSSPRKSRFLNYSQRGKILRAIPPGKFVDFTNSKFKNWLGTASSIARLSLLITMDTGIAHLAGAMGIPVWVLLPGAQAWQYPLGFDYHPFYPSMRMFCNGAEGLENSVDQVCEALRGM